MRRMFLWNRVPSGEVGAASTAAATVRRMRGRSFMLWRRAGDCQAGKRGFGKKLWKETSRREPIVWEGVWAVSMGSGKLLFRNWKYGGQVHLFRCNP